MTVNQFLFSLEENKKALRNLEEYKLNAQRELADQKTMIGNGIKESHSLFTSNQHKFELLKEVEEELHKLIEENTNIKEIVIAESEKNNEKIEQLTPIKLNFEHNMQKLEAAREAFVDMMLNTKNQLSEIKNNNEENSAIISSIRVQNKQLEYAKQEFSDVLDLAKTQHSEGIQLANKLKQKEIDLEQTREYATQEIENLRCGWNRLKEFEIIINNHITEQSIKENNLLQLQESVSQTHEANELARDQAEQSLTYTKEAMEKIQTYQTNSEELKLKFERELDTIKSIRSQKPK